MGKLAALLVGVALTETSAAGELTQRGHDSRAAVESFGKYLRGALQAAMQEGAAVQAIEVCRREAPHIAATIAERHGRHAGAQPRQRPRRLGAIGTEEFRAARRDRRGARKREHAEVTE